MTAYSVLLVHPPPQRPLNPPPLLFVMLFVSNFFLCAYVCGRAFSSFFATVVKRKHNARSFLIYVPFCVPLMKTPLKRLWTLKNCCRFKASNVFMEIFRGNRARRRNMFGKYGTMMLKALLARDSVGFLQWRSRWGWVASRETGRSSRPMQNSIFVDYSAPLVTSLL